MMTQSKLALGTWQFGPDHGFWTDQALEDSKATLRFALKHTIRHIDTASSYGMGRSEQIIGSIWSSYHKREDLQIDTKFMPKAPHLVEKDVLTSLSRLKTSYVDTLYLHWPSSRISLLPILEQAAAQKESDRIKKLGLCNVSISLLEQLKPLLFSTLQVPCSLLWTRNLKPLVQYAQENQIQLAGYSPLGLGLLSGAYRTKPSDERANLYVYSEQAYPHFCRLLDALKTVSQEKKYSMAQVALLWARSQGFDTILVGARRAEQLAQSLATDHMALDSRHIKELDELSETLCSHAPKEWDNLFGHRW
jgi:aryl-alcohol dehydrogenase-like predicted oxidoreductase